MKTFLLKWLGGKWLSQEISRPVTCNITVVSGLCQGADVSRVKQSKKYADMMSSSSISCLASSDQSSISSSSSLSSPLLGPSQPRSSQPTECQLRLGCLPSSSTSSIALSRGCIRSSTSNEKIHHNENRFVVFIIIAQIKVLYI